MSEHSENDRDPGYLFLRLADDMAEQVSSGKLSSGARLPGEITQAKQLGVSIGTVRRVMRELRERGLVVTLPAKGTFVYAAHEPTGSAAGGER